MGEPSQGLFSGVFSYVSREVGSFVTNATGGVVTINTRHQQGKLKKRVRREEPPKPAQNVSSSSGSGSTMPGSLYPRSPSIAPSVMGDREEFDEDDQPGPSKRPRQLHHHTTTRRFASPASTCFFDAFSSPSANPRGKGKQRAVEEDPEEEQFSDVDEDVLAMPPPPVPLLKKGKEKARAEGTIDDWMRGKEQELRDEQRRIERDRDKVDDEERERDKTRIKNLEDEVKRLREELSIQRSTSSASFSMSSLLPNNHFHPPPPPPPPPPPGTLVRAPTTPQANPQVLFASARAALKHAGTPTEAPINPAYSLSRSMTGGSRTGKPTVGIQPDKMADFLKEMKTVRLRKVGIPGMEDRSMSSSLMRGDRDGGELSFSSSFRREREEDAGNSSWQSDISHIFNAGTKSQNGTGDVSAGKKRKRGENSESSRRRSSPSRPDTNVRSNSSSFASTVSVDSDSQPSRQPSSSSRNKPPVPTHPKTSKPSSSTALPPPPLTSQHSRQSSSLTPLSSPPPQPPRSKSPSASIRRTSSASIQSDHELLNQDSNYQLYTLPQGTTGPSRAWDPSAFLPALSLPPSNETPSLCSDLPEGSTSVDDDELEDVESPEGNTSAPHVVVSPEIGAGRGRREVEDIDVEMEMEEEDHYDRRRVEKRPRLSPYPPSRQGGSSTSPTQEDHRSLPLSRHRSPPRFMTPVREDEQPYAKPPSKASHISNAFSKRPPVSPMPVTPSPQRPKPPASRNRDRESERGRSTIPAQPGALDTMDDVVLLHDVHGSQSRRKSKSRSRPPTPHVRRTVSFHDDGNNEEDEGGHDHDLRNEVTEDVQATQEADDNSSEDPLSLGGDTSAESFEHPQNMSLNQSYSSTSYRLDLSRDTARSIPPSRIPIAKSGSLRGRNGGKSDKDTDAAASQTAQTQPRTRSRSRPKKQKQLASSSASASFVSDPGSSRRRTLDQELKDTVEARRSDEPDHFYEESASQSRSTRELRKSTLTAVGSRSTQLGYMAHGGAGGTPVFMGEGYVDGATPEAEDDDEEYHEEGQNEDDLEYLPGPSSNPKKKKRGKTGSNRR